MLVFGWWALLVLVLVCTGLVGLTAFRFGLLPTLFGGAPYMPTHPDLVQAVMKLAAIKPSDRVVDLGSGDGRLVFEAAKRGAKEAIGYEIDAWNVLRARREARRLGIATAQFKAESFWKVSLQDIDVVLVYGLPPYMNRLADKCRTELRPGARIVSLMYELPGWKASQSLENIHLYSV